MCLLIYLHFNNIYYGAAVSENTIILFKYKHCPFKHIIIINMKQLQ